MSPATNDDPPIEESSNTDEINSKTDDRAQENRDESIATIDSIQNLVGNNFNCSEIFFDIASYK